MLHQLYTEAETVPLGSGPICFVRRGAGRPVVLLHGVPLSLLTWRHNLDGLGRGACVIAPDMRGFGRSHKGPGDYSTEGHAEVIRELLAELGVGPATVVGSSYGCAVAVNLALAHPGCVDRLVLINPLGRAGGRHATEQLARIGLITAVMRSALRASSVGRMLLRRGLRRSYADERLVTEDMVIAYHELLRHDAGERSFLATLRALDEGQVEEQIGRVRHPTLLIWGARDQVLPVSDGEFHRARIPGARLEVVEDCGHLPHEEAPARVNQLILDFHRERQGEKPC